MAVISLDLASVDTCPSTTRLAVAQAHRMQLRQPLAAIVRAAQRVAVDGDDLARNDLTDRLDPVAKTGLERLGLQQAEDTPEGIMRRDAIGQLQKLLQLRLFGTSKLRNPDPASGPAEGGGDRNHDHVEPIMTPLERAARVFKRRKMPHQGVVQDHFGHRQQHTIGKHGCRMLTTLSIYFSSRCEYFDAIALGVC